MATLATVRGGRSDSFGAGLPGGRSPGKPAETAVQPSETKPAILRLVDTLRDAPEAGAQIWTGANVSDEAAELRTRIVGRLLVF
jgi:hypothetical protein